MSAKKYQVKLTNRERKYLKKLTTTGKESARKLNRARILLLSDERNPEAAKADSEIATILGVSPATVARTRKRFIEESLGSALKEKPRSGRTPKFSGKDRAEITALACSEPPEGHGRWSLRLLADRLVELELIESISYKTVGEILKKTNSNPT
jgi:transposase